MADGSSRKAMLAWIAGVGSAVSIALIAACATGLGGQIVDVSKLKDKIRNWTQGEALQLTVQGLRSAGANWYVVFPKENMDGARPFIAEGEMPDYKKIFADAFKAGGYAATSLIVRLEVEGKRNQEVTITNIRPVATTRDIALGAFAGIGTQGNETRQMFLGLDDAVPIVRSGLGTESAPFFDSNRIGLTEGHKESLTIELYALSGAYEFDIAIDYEAGGEQFTTTVPRVTEAPFRVSAVPCPLVGYAKLIPSDKRQRLAAMQYDAVTLSDVNPNGSGYVMRARDPSTFCKS